MQRVASRSARCRPAGLHQPRLARRAARAAASKSDLDGRGSNVGEYCSLDDKGSKTEKSLSEKEAEFLEALQAYYFDGESPLNDEEFENLKEELIWSGSKVAVLSSTEQKFLEASMAYSKGSPIMSDEEFDELKGELKQTNSVVTQAGPRCSIRSKRMYSDANPDYLKLTLLNTPAALVVLGFIFAIDDITGFEITKAIELPPPYSILFLWGLVFPSIYVISASITNLVLPDALILKASCPQCGTENQAYFGGIFNVQGPKKVTVAECSKCRADLEYNAIKREVVILKTGEEKEQEKAEAAAKKAAARKAKEASAAGSK